MRKIPRDLLLRRSYTRLDVLLYMQDDSLFSFKPLQQNKVVTLTHQLI